MTVAPSRIIIRPPNWLGDAVLALPAMAAVRRRYPSAHVSVVAVGVVAALLREETDVAPDVVLTLPAGERERIAMIRDGRFDLGLLFPNSFRSAWHLRRAGVPERWGYATASRRWLLTRAAIRPKAAATRHHRDYYRDLVRGLGIDVEDRAPRIGASASARARAAALLQFGGRTAPRSGPLVTLAPGAAYGAAKQWPPVRVAELVARLVKEHDATCALVGADHDREAGRVIDGWLRANAPETAAGVRNVIGRTDVATLVALAGMSRACVSNDSGVMHVAAAAGCPVVAVFGPTDEHVTRPIGSGAVLTADVFCRPCHLRECPIDHRCMKRITVDRVATAVVAAMGGHQ